MSAPSSRIGNTFETLRLWGLSFGAVVLVRMALWLTTYKQIRLWLPDAAGQPDSRFYGRRVALHVRRAARFVPRASCLTQALAAQFILARSGHCSTIRIGVERNGAGSMDAHAWLVCEGRVVIGDLEPELERYTLMTELN
ncbi:lasso peptide biosynthesis B2 protein [Sphingomonas koreensis]|nr:lasso peptide biosynthesis B2 protein [Sphingomonas koreensis]